MLERHLIDCCSPTLASLKSGSMFCCKYSSLECDVEECISRWNESWEGTGLRMRILRKSGQSALIYVFRESALAKTLSDPKVREFLFSHGYDCCGACRECCNCSESIEACLEKLSERIRPGCCTEETCFPHEVGIFLDYPLHDVMGFIHHKGRNCKCTGIWKVYGDVEGAEEKFEKFRKCTEVYGRLWRSGKRSISQLTVAG